MDDLVGAAEIVERLGRSNASLIHDWRRRYADFPAPVLKLRQGLVWHWPAVEAWGRATGRPAQAAGRRMGRKVDVAELVGPAEIVERLKLPSHEAAALAAGRRPS